MKHLNNYCTHKHTSWHVPHTRTTFDHTKFYLWNLIEMVLFFSTCYVSVFLFPFSPYSIVAISIVGIMDLRILGENFAAEAAICCVAFARGGRQNLWEIHGICTGIYSIAMRITRTGKLQSDPCIFRWRLHLRWTFHGKRNNKTQQHHHLC